MYALEDSLGVQCVIVVFLRFVHTKSQGYQRYDSVEDFKGFYHKWVWSCDKNHHHPKESSYEV